MMHRRLRIAGVLLVNLLVAAVLVDVGVRLAYPLVRGETVSWADLRDKARGADHNDAVVTFDPVAAGPDAPVPVLHPYLGYVFQPGSVQPTLHGEALRFSPLGFFGDGPTLEKRDGEVVVAVGGGSVAASFWHHEAARLREALAQMPAYRGKTIRVESYALGGYKQPQMLLTLVYLLAIGAQIDVWIQLDGFNDAVLPVAENLPAGVALDYPRGWNRLAGGDSPRTLALRTAILREQTAREHARTRIAAPPLVYSAAALAWWDVEDRRHADRIGRLVTELNASVDANPVGPEEQDAALRRAVALWKAASIQMARACESNGIEYRQFVQPNQYFPHTKPFSEEELRTALAAGGYRPAAENAYPLLLDAAAELRDQGIPIHDLTGLFVDEPRTVYRDSCCHLNELGNDLLADAVVEALLK